MTRTEALEILAIEESKEIEPKIIIEVKA